jgi:hypothetical protein
MLKIQSEILIKVQEKRVFCFYKLVTLGVLLACISISLLFFRFFLSFFNIRTLALHYLGSVSQSVACKLPALKSLGILFQTSNFRAGCGLSSACLAIRRLPAVQKKKKKAASGQN